MISQDKVIMLGHAGCRLRMGLFLGVLLLVIVLIGCRPAVALYVTGPQGTLVVVVREDEVPLSTAKRLVKQAVSEFIETNGRFPSLEEVREIKVTWRGKRSLEGVSDILSVGVRLATPYDEVP